jgi:hypothetical protein
VGLSGQRQHTLGTARLPFFLTPENRWGRAWTILYLETRPDEDVSARSGFGSAALFNGSFH